MTRNTQLKLFSQLGSEPWANGAGRTRLIHSHVEGGRGAKRDVLWRLSLAELAQSAPFSQLPDLDRVFTLASPGPVALIVDDVERSLLLGESAEFRGESTTKVELTTGQRRWALNLMTHRNLCTGTTTVHHFDGQITLNPAEGVVAATILSGYAVDGRGRIVPRLATLILGDLPEYVIGKECLAAISSVRRR
ncbi:hypothetical protein HP499_24545 [Paenarthrobacter sp. CM16]|uniref:HutD/Ves family protein n=1 Tax=Paenarthrobacter sp. CM16 TaxID=2738447 RepID=UPI0015565914|nr:HutD family protein [Paenarthrobacter sp. CM16]NQD90958.1 hypothetical protein [Paenarthrobacter sp. CM16]